MPLNSPATDISDYIASGGIATLGADLFRFEWGQSTDEDTGGQVDIDAQILVKAESGPEQELRDLVEQPIIQILVRGEKAESSAIVYQRAREVYEFLLGTFKVTINETQYVDFEPMSGPNEVGRDSEDRQTFSMRFWTYRNPTA